MRLSLISRLFHAPALMASPEDWRVLRLLSIYRLLLVAVLITILASGAADVLLGHLDPTLFRRAVNGYGVAALVLFVLVLRGQPVPRAQAHLHLVIDTLAICAIVLATGGVTTGLGVLIITPVVACAMVVPPTHALAQASLAFFFLLGEEFYRQSGNGQNSGEFAAAGVLGLMFFGASLAANRVAQRARVSEAIAERVGNAFENLSALNEAVLRTMETGVLVVDDELFVKTGNAAAQRLLGTRYGLRGRRLSLEAPLLGRRLQQWLLDGQGSGEPVPPNPGGLEVVPRFAKLDGNVPATLILLDDAASVREQAQQMKLAALGRLSAGIAHEIRNPLSAIVHASQLLGEDGDVSDADRRLLDMIERHTQRIDKIIRDVLALSRRDTANPATLTLARWLPRALATYREGLPGQTRQIDCDAVDPQLQVRFDPDHLQQVLSNLLNNAFTHAARSPEAVVVQIRCGRNESGHAWMDIHDNGVGIPAAHLERMFEPFFTTSHHGTGLGLYLARELCEYNLARISYQSIGQGACFRIVFASEG